MRIAMSVCVYYSFDRLFPNIEGVTHRNENCNVCMCILLPWSHISPTWRGLLTEMRIAMSVCVYYSLDHLLSRHGGGCSQKWELQCLNRYIIPLITYFPDMERVAHRNENCNVCICIFFPWSHISPTWRELLIEMRVAMSENVYYSFDHLFPQHGWVCSQKWESQCICVYYSLDHLFPQHGGGCWEKWELQCLCVYIIPLVTYFAKMEGVLTEMRIAMYMCILFPWSLISPNMEGVAHINENCNVYVYVIPLVTYFPQHGGVAHRNENCNACMCILFLWSPISKHRRGYTRKWELQCLYVYIIPLIAYFQT